jgi:hypothetical protein
MALMSLKLTLILGRSLPSRPNSKRLVGLESWSWVSLTAGQVRGWNIVVGSTPDLAILLGVGVAIPVLLWASAYYRKTIKAAGVPFLPEARLMSMMIGSPFFAAGLFIICWTSSEDIHWIDFCVGAALVGFGFFTIFQSALNYLIDRYLMLAASALAANMFMRSTLAAAFPLFADYRESI